MAEHVLMDKKLVLGKVELTATIYLSWNKITEKKTLYLTPPPPPWHYSPQWARASLLSRLHEHTLTLHTR
jgi:hypothetical protein